MQIVSEENASLKEILKNAVIVGEDRTIGDVSVINIIQNKVAIYYTFFDQNKCMYIEVYLFKTCYSVSNSNFYHYSYFLIAVFRCPH